MTDNFITEKTFISATTYRAIQTIKSAKTRAILYLQTKDTELETAVSEKATTATYTAIVNTIWTGSGPYTTSVSVAGILATDNPIADLITGTGPTAQKRLQAKAWSYVSEITTSAGAITLTCYDKKPTTSFTIQLKVVR